MTYYDQFQLDHYGSILPSSEPEETTDGKTYFELEAAIYEQLRAED